MSLQGTSPISERRVMKRSVIAILIVVAVASVSYADSIFDVLTSAVKATTSGVKKVVTGANPGKVVENTVEGTKETAQMAGEATLGGAANTVGVVSQAAGN